MAHLAALTLVSWEETSLAPVGPTWGEVALSVAVVAVVVAVLALGLVLGLRYAKSKKSREDASA